MRHWMQIAWLLAAAVIVAAAPPRPNIVFLLADDLGWKDVGYHGSEIRTPNIDRLAAEGTRLERFYVQPLCTPTRGAFLTGRYPCRTGLQRGVIKPGDTWGLPLTEHTLAQILHDAGYQTAMTGKWHLGGSIAEQKPTRRGFDHQHGFYIGSIDYNTHLRDGIPDWQRDDAPIKQEGYTTHLIGDEAVRLIETRDAGKSLFLYVAFNAVHSPLTAPPPPEDGIYPSIEFEKRRLKAAMTTCMDEQIGRILAALEKQGMRENTLVVFSSDNGGPLGNLAGNNDPLRGEKATLYEGGVRVPVIVRWPGQIKAGAMIDQPMHVVDWLPTFAALAGAKIQSAGPLDGMDLRPALTQGATLGEREILLNVEPTEGAILRGKWKLKVEGELPFVGPGFKGEIELFNLAADLSEKTNLADREPEVVKQLLARLNEYAQQAVPPLGTPESKKSVKRKSP